MCQTEAESDRSSNFKAFSPREQENVPLLLVFLSFLNLHMIIKHLKKKKPGKKKRKIDFTSSELYMRKCHKLYFLPFYVLLIQRTYNILSM